MTVETTDKTILVLGLKTQPRTTACDFCADGDCTMWLYEVIEVEGKRATRATVTAHSDCFERYCYRTFGGYTWVKDPE